MALELTISLRYSIAEMIRDSLASLGKGGSQNFRPKRIRERFETAMLSNSEISRIENDETSL
jgi:hypothetical protein